MGWWRKRDGLVEMGRGEGWVGGGRGDLVEENGWVGGGGSREEEEWISGGKWMGWWRKRDESGEEERSA